MKKASAEFNDGIPEIKEFHGGRSITVWFLVLLPVGLLVGSAIGIFRHVKVEETIEIKASQKINNDEIGQILSNYIHYFGARDLQTKNGREQASLVAKNLAGELQSTNSMMISGSDRGAFEAGDKTWKSYWADIRGVKNSKKIFFLVSSYDGANDLGNAAKIALPIIVAKSLAAEQLDYTLRIVFIPIERDLDAQREWIETHCMKTNEMNLGMFFLSHGDVEYGKGLRHDSWKISAGDRNWAGELLKGTRVMHFGMANLHHGVLDEGVKYQGADVSRVEQAALGLRRILYLVMGADR